MLVTLELDAPANDIIRADTRVRIRAVESGQLPFAAATKAARSRVLLDQTVHTTRVAAGQRAFIFRMSKRIRFFPIPK